MTEQATKIAREIIDYAERGMRAAWPPSYMVPLANEYLRLTQGLVSPEPVIPKWEDQVIAGPCNAGTVLLTTEEGGAFGVVLVEKPNG